MITEAIRVSDAITYGTSAAELVFLLAQRNVTSVTGFTTVVFNANHSIF
jgi:hypothetical protein